MSGALPAWKQKLLDHADEVAKKYFAGIDYSTRTAKCYSIAAFMRSQAEIDAFKNFAGCLTSDWAQSFISNDVLDRERGDFRGGFSIRAGPEFFNLSASSTQEELADAVASTWGPPAVAADFMLDAESFMFVKPKDFPGAAVAIVTVYPTNP